MSNTVNREEHGDRECMPLLASTMTGCIRWRWDDLESALASQLRMLAAGQIDWSNGDTAGGTEPSEASASSAPMIEVSNDDLAEMRVLQTGNS